MNATTSTSPSNSSVPPAPPAPNPAAWVSPSAPSVPRAMTTEQWLVDQRNAGATPEQIAARLVSGGWSADSASAAALRSLRTTDRHRLLYHGLCWGAGLGTLALGSALHLALSGLEYQSQRSSLASAITTALVLLPIALGCGIAVKSVERRDRFAVFSPTRRSLFGWLAGCTATVGLFRLVSYLFDVLYSLTGGTQAPLTLREFSQVIVTVCLAGPLFAWSLVEWRASNVALRSLDPSSDVHAG